MNSHIRISEADRIFSLAIRWRDGWRCQRCNVQYHPDCGASLQCAHFWGRANWNTRFDPDNADALCYGCHSFFHQRPAEHCGWKRERLGDARYRALEMRANTYCKRDWKLALVYAKQLLKKYEGVIIPIAPPY